MYVLLPIYGVYGYIIVLFTSELLNGFISIIQLVKYTKNTGCLRPYNYTVTAEEKAACTPYMQSILTFIEEGAILAPNLPIATKRRIYTGEIGFANNGFGFAAKVGNATAREPFTYFFNQRDDKGNITKTVEDAFTDAQTTITNTLKKAGAIS